MNRMLIAEFAILLQLHAVRVSTLVFVRRIVSLLACRTSQCNDYPHAAHLLLLRSPSSVYVKSSSETIFDGYLQHFIINVERGQHIIAVDMLLKLIWSRWFSRHATADCAERTSAAERDAFRTLTPSCKQYDPFPSQLNMECVCPRPSGTTDCAAK
jgi:hypothetical protein